jgi:predicted nucleotidyltransferase
MKQIDRQEIIRYLQEIKPQLQEAGIDRIGLFGSLAKGEADLLSDIDILIRTTPKFVEQYRDIKGFLYLEALRDRIAKRFGRSVDLCDEAGLKKKMERVIYA